MRPRELENDEIEARAEIYEIFDRFPSIKIETDPADLEVDCTARMYPVSASKAQPQKTTSLTQDSLLFL